MTISGITWSGAAIDDHEIAGRLPRGLATLLEGRNGFILHSGALHVRGASKEPSWHSLRHVCEGEFALADLYSDVLPTDIPFAEDMFGDQFLIRDGGVLRLVAETGEIEEKEASLRGFFERVEADPAGYLNVSLTPNLAPGQLMFAYPPFCMAESKAGAKLKPCPSLEIISFHADFARQIRSVPNGGRVQIRWTK